MSTATRPVEIDSALHSLLEFAGVPYADTVRVELTPNPHAPSGLQLVVEHRDRAFSSSTEGRGVYATITKTLLV